MEMLEFEIKSIGVLKYSRIKSMSVLRNELESFDLSYSLTEVKEVLDSILTNKINHRFGLKFKMCLDTIFESMIYIEYNNYKKYPDYSIGETPEG